MDDIYAKYTNPSSDVGEVRISQDVTADATHTMVTSPTIIAPQIVYIDCDKSLTLMDCINETQKVLININSDAILRIYVVNSIKKSTTFEWIHYLQYLGSLEGRKIEIIYRGRISDVGFLYAFLQEDITVSVAKDSESIDLLTKLKLNFHTF